MTDQLTTLRRKYGYFIPYKRFTCMVSTSKPIYKITTADKYKLIEYAFVVNITYHAYPNNPLKCVYLGRNKKKLKNILKKHYQLSATLDKITKYNEQTKLSTKTKTNTITNIINRVKTDWEHIRS